MADKVVTVKIKLNKSDFIANAKAIETATGSTWKRIADQSSVIGKRIKEWAKDASLAMKAFFAVDEVGRGPFMKMLAALQNSRVAAVSMLRKNAAAIKAMFSADEIGRTPFMRMRDAANKIKTASIATLKKNAASMKQFFAPDEVGRGPFLRMLADLHNLESKSQTAFKRIGQAAKSAFGAGSKGIGTAGSWLDRKMYGSVQMGADGKYGAKKGWLSGLSNLSMTGHDSGGAMALAGVFAAKSAVESIYAKGAGIVQDANHVAEAAAQLSVNARQAGQGYIDPKVLEAEAYKVTQDVKGTSADNVIEAMAQFTSLTGDLKTARASMTTFATVARATGASLTDVAASTAAISQQFKITDPADIREVLSALTYQGKAGAIELSDLATGLQTLAAGGASFGLSGVQGVKTLGGITQIAKQGSGSAAETFTAVQGIFRELAAKTSILEKQKVKVYEGKGANKKTRDPTDIIIDAISTIGGNDVAKKATGLQSIFNDSLKGLKPLLSLYNDTVRNTVGTDKEKTAAGVNALRQALDSAINVAGGWEDVVSDAAKMQKTSSAQMAAASQSLQSKISENVAPKLTEFATGLASSTDAIDFFVFAMEVIADTVEGFGKALKALGIIKEHKKTSYELRDEHKAKKEKLQSELKGMQMTPEQIAIAQTVDPKGLEEKRKKAKELEVQIAGEAAQEKYYNDFANKGGFEWDNDPDNMPVTKTNTRTLKDKFREQQEAAVAAIPQTAGSSRSPGAVIAAQHATDVARGREMFAQREQGQAPAPVRPGPIKFDGAQPVRIVGDDTTRGTIAAPTPGNVPRL